MSNGRINIHGREYKTVALRVSEFREQHKDHAILTDIISNADLVVIKAEILNPQRQVVATGYAEEKRDSTNINKTSALENCETSAIGRALACFGLGGSEYASANEVSEAILQQERAKVADYFIKYNQAVSKYLDAISAALADDHTFFDEIPEQDKKLILSLPAAKGGILTDEQKAQLLKRVK